MPKPIRQALGVDSGGKVEFEFADDRVIVTRVEDVGHEDPAIGSFLRLLENDLRSGQHIASLPDDLARSMLSAVGKQVKLDEDIVGDVAL